MLATPHPEAAPCRPAGSADLASAAPLGRSGWPAWRGVASRRTVRTLTMVGLALVLSACGMPRMIDSQVESYVGTTGAAPGAHYRFERLPSQQSNAAEQERVEAMAQEALQRVGLTLADSQARYSVQVQAQVVSFQPPPRRSTHLVVPYVNADGSPAYSPLRFLSEPPWYLHTVHLVLRDIHSGQIAYETSGRFEGPWSDSATLWPVVMEAALQGYPHPPSGVRTVTLELPPHGVRHDR